MSRMSWNSWSLNLLEPSGLHRAFYGTPLPVYVYIYIYIHTTWVCNDSYIPNIPARYITWYTLRYKSWRVCSEMYNTVLCSNVAEQHEFFELHEHCEISVTRHVWKWYKKNANSACLLLSIMSRSVAQGPVAFLVYCFVTRANTMMKHVRWRKSSKERKIYIQQQTERKLPALVTSCEGTAFENTLLKEGQQWREDEEEDISS